MERSLKAHLRHSCIPALHISVRVETAEGLKSVRDDKKIVRQQRSIFELLDHLAELELTVPADLRLPSPSADSRTEA